MRTVNGFTKKELYSLAWEKPIMAQVELTGNCNLECFHCFRGCRLKRFQDKSKEEWFVVLNSLYDLGVRRIDFTGSESFLYPEFISVLEFSKQKGFEIRINTNGTIDVSLAIKYIDEIIFSVHGLKDVHDKIVRCGGIFQEVEKNISIASNSGIKTSINMSLFQSNYNQLLEVFNYFDSKYNICHFAPVIPISSRLGNDFGEEALKFSSKLLADYIKKLKSIPKEKLVLKHGFQSVFINEPKHYNHSPLLMPNCAAGKYKLVIDCKGDVFPCNFFKENEYFCGNVFTDDMKLIWKEGKGFQIFRDLVLDEKIPEECFSCFKKERCFSGCRAWNEKYGEGGFDYEKDWRCTTGSSFAGD